jgi:hypothetical protein
MVTLPGSVLERYDRFSLYNSPYPAHEAGCAVDLYPGGQAAPSPVAGELLARRTVRCPSKPYAADRDHLLLVDCGDVVARILHVDPTVEAGDRVAVGDEIGTLVRSGFFGQWVDNHVHLGFREPDQNLRRATGSLPLDMDVDVSGVAWNGHGTVVETGPTHVQVDSPTHDGQGFATIASDAGVPLDGGLVHYAGGGALSAAREDLSLLGTSVGGVDGRDVQWRDVAVWVEADSGRRIRATGLSLFASQVPFGAKVVIHEGHDLDLGDRLTVSLEATSDPVRLG